MGNKHFSLNHVLNIPGKVTGYGAGLNSFLLSSLPYLPQLLSEENLILILLTYEFKMMVYHIHTITMSLLWCISYSQSSQVMNFSFPPKDQLTYELTQTKNSFIGNLFSLFFFSPCRQKDYYWCLFGLNINFG